MTASRPSAAPPAASTCGLCGAPGTGLYQGLQDRLFAAPGTWAFRRCRNRRCRLVWLDPMPDPEQMRQAYLDYFTHETPRIGNPARAPRRLRLLRRAYFAVTGVGAMLRDLEHVFLDGVRPGTLLEVGCGAGEQLAVMRRLGWRVLGQEVDAAAATVARERFGLDVRVAPLTAHEFGVDRFDAVVMSHVVEHVDDPVGLLRESRQVLRPGGVLVATTPNVESLAHRWYGRHWLHLDPPRHLHLFRTRTLSRVARMAGFTDVETWTTGARAGWVVAGSRDIARTGRHRFGSVPDTPTRALAAAFRAVEVLVNRPSGRLGEECVLRARK